MESVIISDTSCLIVLDNSVIIAGAKKRGIIPAVRPIFEQISATDFRLPNSLIDAILAELGE